MDASQVAQFIDAKWDDEIVPQLVEYIRIPNKSPMFDADWVKNGHMARAVALMQDWASSQPVPGMQLDVVQLEGRTPLIFIDIPASGQTDTTLNNAASMSNASNDGCQGATFTIPVTLTGASNAA